MGYKANNKLIEQENMTNLRELEQDFVNSKVAQMNETIEKEKERITKELIEYYESHKIEKLDKEGNIVGYGVNLNPLVINNYFFKSITPISSQEPLYNAEKLGMVFDYYMYIMAQINDKLGNYPSSLSNFCKLAGITMSTLRNYKNSDDYSMRVVAEKIYDQIGDENLTMGQLGMVKERTTLFKMRSQNELEEKPTTKVNINVTEMVDVEAIENRINQYKAFTTKKGGKK